MKGIDIGEGRICINPQGIDTSLYAVPEKITEAEQNFEGYKEPTFEVGADGRIFGGDMSAMARLNELKASQEKVEEVAESQENIEMAVAFNAFQPAQ